jgi:hypothetical protein
VRFEDHDRNVFLDTKDLVARHESGALSTILDASGSGSVVTLVNLTAVTRLEGFTITGGSDPSCLGGFIRGGWNIASLDPAMPASNR